MTSFGIPIIRTQTTTSSNTPTFHTAPNNNMAFMAGLNNVLKSGAFQGGLGVGSLAAISSGVGVGIDQQLKMQKHMNEQTKMAEEQGIMQKKQHDLAMAVGEVSKKIAEAKLGEMGGGPEIVDVTPGVPAKIGELPQGKSRICNQNLYITTAAATTIIIIGVSVYLYKSMADNRGEPDVLDIINELDKVIQRIEQEKESGVSGVLLAGLQKKKTILEKKLQMYI